MKKLNVKSLLNFSFVVIMLLLPSVLWSQENQSQTRERLLMDFGWKFAYGHPFDAAKDFDHGTSYFSYYAKAGYGDGPAAAGFDDRAWRQLDLPHDFAVEQPFDPRGSHSHGYKAIGRNFPEVSVGWYRKHFVIPASDLGRRITVTFDGVHRDSKVWINGHYLGNEPSGYYSFTYDLTEYLNYGGNNVIAVRSDVTAEEGWYYEGAGIYRHVWLGKTSPLHVAHDGTFVHSMIDFSANRALVNVETIVVNHQKNKATLQVRQELVDATGKVVAETISGTETIEPFSEKEFMQVLDVVDPHLWSLEDPYLYTVRTSIVCNVETIDVYTTSTGIRSIRFDSSKGFFLNEKHVKLKGTNNHQDHAGVGTAIPDGLQVFRVQKLKEMGSNAIRSSHNPPTPELLDACDRLGMLVIDEHRLMGTAPFVKDQLKRLIKRDRNHPSVIVWSLGNEEWAIEGNVTGERIIQEMQSFATKLDPTRPKNAASSGGWGYGISKQIEVMGFNYLHHGSTDEYHKNFPNTPTIGTEEGSTNTTRGIYFDDPKRHHLAAYDRATENGLFYSIEHCWRHYDSRDYLSGMFIWTGFDYRGEPTPFGWPSISSYFGMYDVCGFPKDNVFYLKSWWGSEPVLHLLPHWNWKGREGEPIKVVAYSNCDEVELFLNRKSAGRKKMEKNSHVSWEIPYKSGSLRAVGYKNGRKFMEKTVETTDAPIALRLEPHLQSLKADGEDLAVVAVSSTDQKGRLVPTAGNKVWFEIEGPGKIIGVGNGDPTCLEPDKVIDRVHILKISRLKAKPIESIHENPADESDLNAPEWKLAHELGKETKDSKPLLYRGTFAVPELTEGATIRFFF
jgi:beta-galactosidase